MGGFCDVFSAEDEEGVGGEGGEGGGGGGCVCLYGALGGGAEGGGVGEGGGEGGGVGAGVLMLRVADGIGDLNPNGLEER